jgi:hypothetical protein
VSSTIAEWGFAEQWTLNGFGPVIILLGHCTVYKILYHCASGDRKKRIFWQLIGSLFFWGKMIYMTMQELVFQVSRYLIIL